MVLCINIPTWCIAIHWKTGETGGHYDNDEMLDSPGGNRSTRRKPPTYGKSFNKYVFILISTTRKLPPKFMCWEILTLPSRGLWQSIAPAVGKYNIHIYSRREGNEMCFRRASWSTPDFMIMISRMQKAQVESRLGKDVKLMRIFVYNLTQWP